MTPSPKGIALTASAFSGVATLHQADRFAHQGLSSHRSIENSNSVG